jgi:hypothetical protein
MMSFSVVGAHNQQAFYMFKCGKKIKKHKTKGGCFSPISMVQTDIVPSL